MRNCVGVREAEHVGADEYPEQDLEDDDRQRHAGGHQTRHERREGAGDDDGEKGLAVDADHVGGGAPRIDAPAAREGLARLQPDQPLAAPKRVRWTRHRLDGEAAPVHVRKRIAREHHHVRILLVDPERELAAPVRVSQLDASSAVLVAPEVGEGMVQDGRADRPRLAEVVVRALDRDASNRDAALVGDAAAWRRGRAA